MNCKPLRKHAACLLVAVGVLLVYNGNARAQAAPDKVSARSALVMEQSSRRVLFEKNAHQQMPMASCTKVMTALVALEYGKPGDTVTVGPHAAGVEGSSIYLKAGEKLTLEQMLYGLMLQSGNDAAVAIAEHVGGSVDGFLGLMNKTAEELGAVDTHFASPNGLDKPGHYTTAYDLALITAAAMDNTDFRRIVATKSKTMPLYGAENGRLVRNKNKLLWSYDGANGVKTGYTKGAGRCFVGAAQREDMQLIAVVLDCGPMFEESMQLMDEAFARYDMVPVLQGKLAYGVLPTAEGITGSVPFGAERTLRLPLDTEEAKRVVLRIRKEENVQAPVAQGQQVGSADVILDGKALWEMPLVSLGSDERRNYFWYVKKVAGEYLWKNNRAFGFKSIWPSAG